MDDLDLTGLRTKATQAGEGVAKLTSSSPQMLNELRSSLTNIFAKDNPLIRARDQALSTFLSTPGTTRAQLLPQNLPQVEGSFLNLSPTQQASIVQSRYNAALAPLLGLNQAVTAGYGTIGDIVSGAGTSLQALIDAETLKSNLAQKAFENALAQAQEARLNRTSGSGTGLDLASLIDLIRGPQQTVPTPVSGSTFVPDTQGQTITIPGQGTIQAYTPAPINPPAGRFNLLAQLGAIPELLFGRSQPATPATSLNILPISGGRIANR